MTTPNTDERDWLYPNGGRPTCTVCHERPVYMAGKCGSCWADEAVDARIADRRPWTARQLDIILEHAGELAKDLERRPNSSELAAFLEDRERETRDDEPELSTELRVIAAGFRSAGA